MVEALLAELEILTNRERPGAFFSIQIAPGKLFATIRGR